MKFRGNSYCTSQVNLLKVLQLLLRATIYDLDGSPTYRGVRAARTLASEALLHLEEEMSRNVAGEELRVRRGDLLALDNVDGGANDHVVGLLVEGVVRVGNAVVIHNAEERIEGAIVELLVVGGAIVGLVESVGAQHGDSAVHDLDQLLVGGEVLEAFGCVAHLGAMIVIQIGLQAIDQIALVFAQVDGTCHAQQANDHRVGHIGLIGAPRLEHIAVGLVLLLLGAQTAHGQAAALATHEARVGQDLEADTARVQ